MKLCCDCSFEHSLLSHESTFIDNTASFLQGLAAVTEDHAASAASSAGPGAGARAAIRLPNSGAPLWPHKYYSSTCIVLRQYGRPRLVCSMLYSRTLMWRRRTLRFLTLFARFSRHVWWWGRPTLRRVCGRRSSIATASPAGRQLP